MHQHNSRVIISGGGTGGHIYPALAIADALVQKQQGTEILFVGAKGKMEMQKVPPAGYPIEGLWISGLQRSFTLKNVLFPLKLLMSLMKARKIIKQFKPSVVVGVGGYASGPTVGMAARRGIPCLIQEQNSYPGITNKWLAGKVDRICVAYDDMEKYFPKEKIIKTGNPVRKDIVRHGDVMKEACSYFELEEGTKNLLIIGGSQGSLAINEGILHNLEILSGTGLQIIWQTGEKYAIVAQNVVERMKYKGIKILPFIERMDYAYSVADVVVSRAGAIAISELCVAGKAAILIPLPSAAEDHQKKNALKLVDNNAALMIENKDIVNEIGKVITSLFADEEKRKSLSLNISKLAITDAAERIAEEIIQLIQYKN